jgi:hypothetical protein
MDLLRWRWVLRVSLISSSFLPVTRETETKILCSFFVPGGTMVIQVRDDDDGIRLALGRCGKSIPTYGIRTHSIQVEGVTSCPYCMNNKYPTTNPTPIVFHPFFRRRPSSAYSLTMDSQTLLPTSTDTPSRSGANRLYLGTREEPRSWSCCSATTFGFGDESVTRQSSKRKESDNDDALRFREQSPRMMSL